jgi:hypothetical protein
MPNLTVKVLSTVAPSFGETINTLAFSGGALRGMPSAAVTNIEAPNSTPAIVTRDKRAFIRFSTFL